MLAVYTRIHIPMIDNSILDNSICFRHVFVQVLYVEMTEKIYLPRTRIERVTFPLQVERATTTPTRLDKVSPWLVKVRAS